MICGNVLYHPFSSFLPTLNGLYFGSSFRGDCGPPSICNTLVVQLVILPYHIVRFCWWALRWIVIFTILRRPYGPEEKEYLTRWRLGYNQTRWDSLHEETRAHYNRLELWRRENFKVSATSLAVDLNSVSRSICHHLYFVSRPIRRPWRRKFEFAPQRIPIRSAIADM